MTDNTAPTTKAMFKYPLSEKDVTVVPYGELSFLRKAVYQADGVMLFVEHATSAPKTPIVDGGLEVQLVRTGQDVEGEWIFLDTVDLLVPSKGKIKSYVFHVYFRPVVAAQVSDEEIWKVLGDK